MKTYSTVPGTQERSREIHCPLCDHREYKSFWGFDNINYVKCPSCSLVYQNPQPIVDFVEERYDDDYFTYEIKNEDAFLDLMLLGLKDVGFTHGCMNAKQGRILDIGCATGLFLEHMKKSGWHTNGVEVCRSAAEFGIEKRGLDIFIGNIESAPFEDGTFDIIHLSHVIEHINRPDKFVEKIEKLLKPGGIVYCTTPNVSGLQPRIFKERWRSAIPDHLFLFSTKTLKKMFTRTGLVITAHKTWGGLCAGSGYHELVKKTLDRAAKPLGFGDVVIIKAIKPI